MTGPRTIWLAVAWVALVALGGVAVVAPSVRSIQALADERAELEDRVARSDDGAAAVRRLQEVLADVKNRAGRDVRPIPTDSDVASLIRSLTAQLDRLSIGEREITTGAATRLDDVSTMPMSVRAEGNFLSVYDALRWIESLPRLVRVQRLKFETDKLGDGSPGRVRADLLLDLFFAPTGAQAPANAVAGAGGGEGQ